MTEVHVHFVLSFLFFSSSHYADIAMAVRICIPFLVFCGAWLAYADINCRKTGAGRFPDPGDDKCMKYIICIYVKVRDIYIMYKTICPDGTVFDPRASNCTSPDSYDCSSRALATIDPSFKICSYDGYIADLQTNCTTYIQCVNILGTFTQLRHSCPASTYFNPDTTLCEPDYNCTDFICSEPGRYADTTDFTCHKYHYCVQMSNGTVTRLELTCPAYTMFNPITKVCTAEEICGL